VTRISIRRVLEAISVLYGISRTLASPHVAHVSPTGSNSADLSTSRAREMAIFHGETHQKHRTRSRWAKALGGSRPSARICIKALHISTLSGILRGGRQVARKRSAGAVAITRGYGTDLRRSGTTEPLLGSVGWIGGAPGVQPASRTCWWRWSLGALCVVAISWPLGVTSTAPCWHAALVVSPAAAHRSRGTEQTQHLAGCGDRSAASDRAFLSPRRS
jgi:hypothetical protein